MIEYMSWVKEMFPSISPYTHQMAMSSVREYIKNHGSIDYIAPSPLPFLAQGDILKDMFFWHISDSGELIEINSPGILLSNTCDAENDDLILFSPLIAITAFEENGFNKDAIVMNHYTSLLYLPEPPLKDYVVDLSVATSYNRELIMSSINSQKLNKISSLSLKGYYFFLSKLTVHLMRPEACDANFERTA